MAALGKLFAVAENYPELKANQNFLALQQELSNTEDRIQAARRFYNANVQDYNARVQSFPSNVIAGMFGFKEEEFFEIPEAERAAVAEAPRVDFGALPAAAAPPHLPPRGGSAARRPLRAASGRSGPRASGGSTGRRRHLPRSDRPDDREQELDGGQADHDRPDARRIRRPTPASSDDTASANVMSASSNASTRPRMRSGTISWSPYVDSVHWPPPPRWASMTNTPASQMVGIHGTTP